MSRVFRRGVPELPSSKDPDTNPGYDAPSATPSGAKSRTTARTTWEQVVLLGCDRLDRVAQARGAAIRPGREGGSDRAAALGIRCVRCPQLMVGAVHPQVARCQFDLE